MRVHNSVVLVVATTLSMCVENALAVSREDQVDTCILSGTCLNLTIVYLLNSWMLSHFVLYYIWLGSSFLSFLTATQ